MSLVAPASSTNLRNEYNFQTAAHISLTQPQQFIDITCVNVYMVIQEEWSIFWEVAVPVFVGGGVHTNMCLIRG